MFDLKDPKDLKDIKDLKDLKDLQSVLLWNMDTQISLVRFAFTYNFGLIPNAYQRIPDAYHCILF